MHTYVLAAALSTVVHQLIACNSQPGSKYGARHGFQHRDCICLASGQVCTLNKIACMRSLFARLRSQNSSIRSINAPCVACLSNEWAASLLCFKHSVQVFTYALRPMHAYSDDSDDGCMPTSIPPASSPKDRGPVVGWELRLVMEYCGQVGAAQWLQAGLSACP